jgi:hypothetical protein
MRETAVNMLGKRLVVFVLAWLSFGCLLGQFYGLWTMRFFGCWVLPAATALLAISAYSHRHLAHGLSNPYTWIVQGAVAGGVAAVAYDLYRLPFVLNGAPLFKVFPRFGELLLGGTEPRWLVHGLGWTYHFSNGTALGIMFLVMASCFRRPMLFWGAVAWALFVEAMLLITPYATFFELKVNARFLFLTASAHLVFGVVLGVYFRSRLGSNIDTVREI